VQRAAWSRQLLQQQRRRRLGAAHLASLAVNQVARVQHEGERRRDCVPGLSCGAHGGARQAVVAHDAQGGRLGPDVRVLRVADQAERSKRLPRAERPEKERAQERHEQEES